MRTEFLIKSKGITLIALVVTIIVLLILAGVAINLAIGNNGIFTRAQDATIRHENASVYEQLQFIIADYQMNDVENNTSTDILSKLIADGYVNEDHTLNVEPLMGRSMNTGNGNLEQGDVYVIEQSQKTASSIISDSNNSIGYYLIYYNEDKTEINLGLAFENMEHIEAPTTSGLKLKIRPSYYESPSSSFNSNYSINTLNTLSTSILPLSTFVESRNIAILCFLTYADSLNVNWGDGTVENLSTLDIDDIENYGEIGHAFFQTLTELLDYYNLNGYKIFLEAHTYQDSKEYSVEINGDIKVILPFTGHSLLEIENWGQSEYDRILLSGSEHLTQIASPNETNFKNITYIAYSFYNCSSIQYIP